MEDVNVKILNELIVARLCSYFEMVVNRKTPLFIKNEGVGQDTWSGVTIEDMAYYITKDI